MDYIDVTIDITHNDAFRYRVRTNGDFPDLIDILYEEFEEKGKGWVTVSELRGLSIELVEKIHQFSVIINTHSKMAEPFKEIL